MDTNKHNSKVTTSLLIKSSFWYTLSGFLSKATVFITTPLFTRLLSNEQYGDFTVFASWQMILLTICSLEVYATINRARFDFTKHEEFNGYISSSLFLSTIFTAIIFLLYLVFQSIFKKIFLIDHKYMVFMFCYILTYPAFEMFQAKQRIDYKYKCNAFITFALAIGSTGFSVFFAILLKEDRLWGRIVGQYCLYIASGLIFYICFLAKSISIRLRYVKYALRLSIPLVFSYLGSSVLLLSDSIISKHLCSGKQVSYLSITHTCANIMLILVQLLNNAWSPWFYDKLKIFDYDEIRRTFRVYVWVLIFCTFTVIVIAPELLILLGGEKYLEAIYIVPVSLLNGVFSVLTYQFVNLETYYKKPEYSAIITGCVAIINILLDIIGVKIWGYRAVCYVTLLCQILLVSIHFFCTKKMKIDRILPLRDICIYIISSVFLIPIALVLYQSNVIRWGLMGVIFLSIGIVVLIKHEKIISAVRNFRKST